MSEQMLKSAVRLRFSTSSSDDPLTRSMESLVERNSSPQMATMTMPALSAATLADIAADTIEPYGSQSSREQDSVIEVSQTSAAPAAPYQAPTSGPKPAGKLTTQYVMPDGSVITGKGLGRGRPGVKRGPRKSRLSEEISTESPSMPPMRLTTPQALPAATKRKRADSEASNIRARSVSSSLESRESSVEYNPTSTQTRSGRQTQKPVPIITPAAPPSASSTPASKKVSTPTTSTPVFKTHPKIKRKIYRGKEQFALCEHCLRGFGPPGNVIVFCDACNKCWHQKCHQPQIPKEIIADTKAEWFCATCDRILHGNKKSKKVPAKPGTSSASTAATATALPPPPPPVQKFGLPIVGAIALTLEQRKKYLDGLSREKLIELVLRAGDLAPQMPIFETPIPLPRPMPQTQPQFTSNYVTPVFETPKFDNVKAGSGANDMPDEGYDDSFDEHAALYPKVGEGAKLPPEREDLNMLLEGPESRTFSHWIRGMPIKVEVDTLPLK